MKNERAKALEESHLERRFWHLWFVLVAVSILTTGGLAASISPLRQVIEARWPWAGTEAILLCGLYVVVVFFAAYLTLQQRRILALRAGLRTAQQQAREVRRRHRDRMVALYTVSQAMGEENDPQKVFECIADMCKHVFDAERVSLMVLDPEREHMVVRAAVGHPNPQEVLGQRRRLGEGIAGWVAQHREPLLLGAHSDLSQFHGHQQTSTPPASAMVVPLIVRDEVAGVLSVTNLQVEAGYDDEDLTDLRVFAEIAEYCIRHAEQADWMRSLVESLQEPKKPAVSPAPPDEPDFYERLLEDIKVTRPVRILSGLRGRDPVSSRNR